MKIALVAPTYLPARRANTFQVLKMAQALVGIGHEVRVAAPEAAPAKSVLEAERSWPALARHYGLHREFPLVWLPVNDRLRRYDYAWRAYRWARAWGAQLLYTRLPQAAALASQAGLPVIFEVHDLPIGRSAARLLSLFMSGRGACRLVVISRALAGDLSRAFGVPESPSFTLVASDGVDLERYRDLPSPGIARQELAARCPDILADLTRWDFVAGYTGHLYAGRGVELLLELATRLPGTGFLIVGGELEEVERLRAERDTRQLSNLYLTGFVPNADLPLYQAACEALLMPYQRRVAASSGGNIAAYLSPMKLFEYLACGRALVSSDLPVLREVLSPENCVLLPPEEPAAWAEALLELCHNPGRQAALGAEARRCVESFTWEARAARILEGIGGEQRVVSL